MPLFRCPRDIAGIVAQVQPQGVWSFAQVVVVVVMTHEGCGRWLGLQVVVVVVVVVVLVAISRGAVGVRARER